MAQETLKITITADNQQAVKNIQETVTATTKLGTAFKTLPSTSNQATNALSNLSRVAQDAPYGFIGIANNLNPLLESFQRLSKDAGGAGGALKAMAQGLMGPAGIGLALGAVSSILVAFGPKIGDFILQTTEAEKTQSKLSDAIAKGTGEALAEGERLTILSGIVQDVTKSTKEREEALNQIKSTYKGNLELQKIDINDGAALTLVLDNITGALKRKAMAQAFAGLIAEEEAKKARLQLSSLKEMRDDVSGVTAAYEFLKASLKNAGGLMTAVDYNTQITNKALTQNSDAIKDIDTNLAVLDTQYRSVISDQIKFGDSSQLATNALKKQRTEAVGLSQDIKEMIYEYQHSVHPTRAQRRTATPLLRTFIDAPAAKQNVSDKNPAFINAYLAQQTIKSKDALKAYNQQLQLAGTITDTVTPAFEAMFQAMANGENIGKALEESFKQIIMQLTTMIIKALIFKAVMSALGIPTMGGGGGGFTNFNPFGAGGDGGGSFVLRGQDLLLATNRAQKASNLKGQNISLA
jgi:hypothetical protein